MLDEDGEVSSDDILLKKRCFFYNPAKSTVNAEDYLTVIPYLPKKGFSRDFQLILQLFLKDTAEVGLDALMDFLEDPEAEEFVMEWNQEVFEEGKAGLEEGEFYPYPRYQELVVDIDISDFTGCKLPSFVEISY